MKKFDLISICVLILGISSVPLFGIGLSPQSDCAECLDEFVIFDAYFNTETTQIKRKRLAYLLKTMSEERDKIAYVISYGSTEAINCEAIENLKLVREFFRLHKDIPNSRIVYVDGGFRSRGMTEFYLVPSGAVFPTPKYQINDVLNGSKSNFGKIQ